MPNSPLSLYKAKIAAGYYRPDPQQEKAIRYLQELYQNLLKALDKQKSRGWAGWSLDIFQSFGRARINTAKGVYLYGGVGRGKSMLMDLFYECLPPEIKKRRVHFHEFMIEVHDYFHARRSADDFSEGIDNLLPSLAAVIATRSQILCFDEFHVTDVADAMILGRLFTTLMDQGVIMVSTSNWPPDDLYKDGLQRERFLPFIDLLKQRMEIVHLDSDTDYRAKLLEQEGNYFWPLNANTRKKIDTVFEKLTNGAVPQRQILQVKGRPLISSKAVQGVAAFTFQELCENPHGAEDYLEIARNYRTVFLENVPKIGYDRRNEAKRFMTLIDTLYDQGTKLIISADAPPENLYRGHDYEFEFQRTVSRLNEMQSHAYLEK